MKYFIFSIICACLIAQFVSTKDLYAGTKGPLQKSFTKVKGGSYEIRDGNCTSALVGDLVFQDHIHKKAIPLTVRDSTSKWHGDQKIYCVLATSQKPASEGSTVAITEGGVNHTFITLYMESKRGHGFEYNIQVYGKLN